MKILWTMSILAAFLCTLMVGQSSQSSITGVWRVSERTPGGKNKTANKSPQPGFYIFTAKHYSIVRVDSDQPRPPVPDQDKATDAQIAAAWRPFTANAGTYELSGNTLTIHPTVAKNPNTMAAGSFQKVTLQISGNNMTLTPIANNQGPVKDGGSIRLTRAE